MRQILLKKGCFDFKMKVLYFMFVCVSLYCYADGDSAPFITPCHASDSACLKTSAQKAVPVLAAGVPSLGIQSMDPMRVGRVVAKQAGLEMDFQNTLVKGLRNCVVENLKRKDKQTYLDLKCSVVLVGDYKLGGNLRFLPIEGNGKYKIKIRDILVKIMFQWEDRVVDGMKHWHVRSWKHTAEVLTGAHYQFDNLFNGNRKLSSPVCRGHVAERHLRVLFKTNLVSSPLFSALMETGP